MSDRPTILDRLPIVAGNLHELAKGDADQDLIAELENLDRIVLDMATEMRPTVDGSVKQAAVEALKYHRMRSHQGVQPHCACGWTTPQKYWAADHLQHVADEVLAAGRTPIGEHSSNPREDG